MAFLVNVRVSGLSGSFGVQRVGVEGEAFQRFGAEVFSGFLICRRRDRICTYS